MSLQPNCCISLWTLTRPAHWSDQPLSVTVIALTSDPLVANAYIIAPRSSTSASVSMRRLAEDGAGMQPRQKRRRAE